MEADKWYNPEITTGIQGYNYGMKLLNQYFWRYVYQSLHFSCFHCPVCAVTRRIARDVESDQGYRIWALNALSYGWWQKYIYQYNDADHIVLRCYRRRKNRARIIC